MYNLLIYANNQNLLLTKLTYRDCIVNLVQRNVKHNYRMVKI